MRREAPRDPRRLADDAGLGLDGAVLAAALDERREIARPQDAAGEGAGEGKEPSADAGGELGVERAGAGAGQGHTGAEQGAAEDVAVVAGEEAERGGAARLDLDVAELLGDGVYDAVRRLSQYAGPCKRELSE